MRISEVHSKKAVETIIKYFGGDVSIWLFGSRVHDKKRGGDVDLYVELQSSVFWNGDILMKEMRCISDLEDIFDLPVDLIIGPNNSLVCQIAKQTGILLHE